MKAQFLLLSLLLISGIVSAQDTIFVKTGEVIPAVIVEKTSMEIKYKKFGQAESAAIYSVFVSDIKSIHYKDGIIADYMQSDENTGNTQPQSAIDMSGTMKSMRLSVGLSYEKFNRNPDDNLQLFWQDINGPNSPEITGNPEIMAEMSDGILLEVDNIISASVITQFSNILNHRIHGGVPQLKKLDKNKINA